MKKKKITTIVLILSSITLALLAILGVTQAYQSSTAYSPVKNEYSTGTLSITAVNKTENISLTDALPLSDADALAEEPYVFTIKNIGNVDYKFNIKLLSTTGSNTINSDYIKVKIDEETTGVLSSYTDSKIKENIVLKAGETVDIKLWVWLSKSSPATPNSEIGKTFTSQIVVDGQAIYTSNNNGSSISAVQYIKNLYANANKQEVTNNSITYHIARGVGLMNDRLGGTSADLDAGNIRYYGANPDNYLWLGETYASDYTVKGTYYRNYNSVQECLDDEGFAADSEYASIYCGPDVTIPAGSKKLYRIIGVFNNKLKVISNEHIGYYSWDTSSSSVNSGYGINEWSQADLMKLLNPGYSTDSVNNSLYWSKGTGNCYNALNNGTTTCDFTNIGLSASVQSLISDETWYLGGYNSNSIYSNQIYSYERGTTVVSNPSDGVSRTTTWTGKIALAYPSDSGYAADFESCSVTLSNYNSDDCRNYNWLLNKGDFWLLTPYSTNGVNAWNVISTYISNGDNVSYRRGVRPVFYLNSNVTISSGTGTESDPYVITS